MQNYQTLFWIFFRKFVDFLEKISFAIALFRIEIDRILIKIFILL